MMKRDSYKDAHHLARGRCRFPEFAGTFVEFEGGRIYIGTHAVFTFADHLSLCPPSTADIIDTSWKTKQSRRDWLDIARATGKLPLP